ncbi:unnamed protein product, partial [Heterosigma akashiwo]
MPDWDMWHEAAVQEYKSLVANDVFELVERPTNKNVIKSRWVLAKKFEDGVLKKYKGRLVAKGYSQQPGIDYAATFAPVVSAPSLRVILSLAAEQGLSLSQLDLLQTAFLNGTLTEELYMEQPEGFRDPEFPDHNFLGLKINRNLGKKTIHVSQSQFIKDALIKFGYDHCPPAKTPMDPTMDLSVNKEYKANEDDINRFRSMVGTLSWIATWSIPEISFAVPKLQRATNYPEAKHFAAAGRVFKYLKGSGNKSIKLGGGTILRAYCDADFCTDRIDGKSVTGYIAEYLALGECAKDVMWLRYLLAELGFKQIKPTTVNEDNTACISWATEITVTRKNRHLHVNYHYVRELVQQKEIEVKYINTSEQVGDLFTKALNEKSFEIFS